MSKIYFSSNVSVEASEMCISVNNMQNDSKPS